MNGFIPREFIPRESDKNRLFWYNSGMKIKTKARAFTIIEMLVVIGIIGLLTAIILPTIAGSRARARDSQRISDLSQLQGALEFFYDRCGQYPGVASSGGVDKNSSCQIAGGGSVTMVPTFISQIPTPPSGQDFYDYAVLNDSLAGKNINYILHTKLEFYNAAISKGLSVNVVGSMRSPPNGWDTWHFSTGESFTGTPYGSCSNAAGSVDYCVSSQ